MSAKKVWMTAIIAGISAAWVTPSLAQTGATTRISTAQCPDIAAVACRDAIWQQAFAAYQKKEYSLARTLLTELLARSDMALPASEEMRASALQVLAAVCLTLQDVTGSKEAGRQALAIWQRRANPGDKQNRLTTQLNLASALAMAQDFGEAQTLALQFVIEIGPVSAENTVQHINANELLATIHAGRQGPVSELVRLRALVVALYRGQSVRPEDAALHRFALARALANLADAQIVARENTPAQASLWEAEALLTSIALPESDPDWVTLRSRYLTLRMAQGDRCGAQAMAARILSDAEPRGGRSLSQALIQSGEIYRYHRAAALTAPLWSRATVLEFDMACPPNALGRNINLIACVGSPLLIDHLHNVGMALRYEGQGRASAGYRSLVHAGDFLRTRNLARFSLNRDASNAYTASRVIFRDQITTAWAINDPSGAPKPLPQPWICPTQ